VYYPTLGRKGVSINTIGRYCRVLSQFRVFLSRSNYFYCFGVSRFRFSVFFGAEERNHAILCIIPTLGRKMVSINTIGGYFRVFPQFREFLCRYKMTFIVLGSRVFGFRFSFFRSGRTKTCYSVYYPT